jgi:hypothetical protein
MACFVRECSVGSVPRARKTELSDCLIHSLASVANRLADLSGVAKRIDHPHAAAFERAVCDVLDVIPSLD